MTQQKSVWIDMTDLSSWHGHFTGIQRVVYNIAKGYHNAGQANFFIFDPIRETFHDFDFTAFVGLVESDAIQQSSPLPSRKTKIKAKVRQAYLYAPQPVKNIVTPGRLKKVAAKGYSQYMRVNNLRSKTKRLFASAEVKSSIEFAANDSILILGNSWDRPNLLTSLKDVKRHKSLKVYQVIYDLIPIFQPQAFNEELFNIYTKNMFEVATISDGLMAISNSSKKDFIRFCRELMITPPPVSVIRLGDDVPVSADPIPPSGLAEDERFVVCVGTIEARKNHALLYYTWKEGLRQGLDMPKLIIVGRPGWYTGDILHTMTTDPDTRNRITIMNNVSDGELVWLYKNCLFTAYPSYYEGWGLPVAESLAMGKVCLTSNVSSMPEAGGKYCVYHSPFDSRECLEGVIKLLDSSYREKLEKLISDDYKLTTWKTTYNQFKKAVA